MNGKYIDDKQQRFQYKPMYGIDQKVNCTKLIRMNFDQCEIQAQNTWDITIDDYFFSEKHFCCFIWTTVDCETQVVNECDEKFGKLLKDSTIDWFRDACHSYAYSSWSCWWLAKKNRRIVIGSCIAVILLIIIVVGGYCVIQYV
ncbi:hypothetical protein BLA29_002904 [Euroglyphus maynei]|uniref:Uncharacterized protein n=1 Tax=Euroglyphus maynei TaxID=6958 RepID=A0A1Y3AT43_EURMA|nr:hypothetical protein BLA29_002904 [Euroglyphus maynei]